MLLTPCNIPPNAPPPPPPTPPHKVQGTCVLLWPPPQIDCAAPGCTWRRRMSRPALCAASSWLLLCGTTPGSEAESGIGQGSHYRQAATVTARFCMVIYCMWWTLCDIQKNSVNVDFISFWNNAKPFCHPPPSLSFCCANCENGTDSVKKAVSNSKVHFNSIICTPFILVCSHPKPILHSTAEDKDIPAKTCSSSAEHLLWTLQIFFFLPGLPNHNLTLLSNFLLT